MSNSEPAAVRHHPVLGTVAFDEAMFWWRAQQPIALAGGDQVMLTLSISAEPDLPAERFDEAAETLRRLDARSLRQLVAEELLELYNDTWRQDGNAELDLDGFGTRIRPTSVDVSEDGVEIYFDDGGLFGQHSIVVLLNTDLDLVDVKLAG